MKLVIEQSAGQAEPEIIVRCGLIDQIGGLGDALAALRAML